jgi:hypothetical protein
LPAIENSLKKALYIFDLKDYHLISINFLPKGLVGIVSGSVGCSRWLFIFGATRCLANVAGFPAEVFGLQTIARLKEIQ